MSHGSLSKHSERIHSGTDSIYQLSTD